MVSWAQQDQAEKDQTVEKAAPSTKDTIEDLNEQYQLKFQQFDERIAAYDETIADLELSMFDDQEVDEDQRGIDIYGFFDVAFVKTLAHKGSLMEGLTNRESTFVLQNTNLYFSSRMSDSLSAITELRFTFRPHGNEQQFEFPAAGLAYERIDTEVDDQLSNEHFRLGGVSIERAHLTWQPRDYFGLIAGYYLTPYGIWNEEHGSPVRTSIRPPHMSVARVVPQAQLGIAVKGRFFPAARTYFDYGITLSNGRGPMDTVMDLDENKALGLKLKLIYEGKKFRLSAGGYGYMGDYTDIKRYVKSVTPEFSVGQEVTESYSEYIGAFDLLLEAGDFRFQGEYVWRLTQYDIRVPRPQMEGPGYKPDYLAYGGYGMLSYTLPLEHLLGEMKLAPYVSLEFSEQDETIDLFSILISVVGLNFKPSAYVVLKLEGTYLHPTKNDDFRVAFIMAQMAVSF